MFLLTHMLFLDGPAAERPSARNTRYLHCHCGCPRTIECPTGSGRQMTLYQVAEELGRRLGNIFLRNERGERPVYGGTRKFQDDPHWRDVVCSGCSTRSRAANLDADVKDAGLLVFRLHKPSW